MLKPGNKIICVKDLGISFQKGKIYTIESIKSQYYTFNGWAFSIKFDKQYPSDWFDNYFISLKEQRQLKLNKIINEKI